jgi:F-type H+-transporting ATPase subunit delta
MSLRTLSNRYARALLDVAAKESDPQKVEQDLASVVNAIAANDDARRVLGHPALPPATRRNIVDAIAKKAEAEAPVAKLLVLLADRGRLEILPQLLESYRERLRAHRNIVSASVVSAAPLSPEHVAALERRLAALTGKQMQVEVTTDPSLIGGIVARIGSTVYDGSIKTQLEKMKQQLVENA